MVVIYQAIMVVKVKCELTYKHNLQSIHNIILA